MPNEGITMVKINMVVQPKHPSEGIIRWSNFRACNLNTQVKGLLDGLVLKPKNLHVCGGSEGVAVFLIQQLNNN